GPPPPPPGPRPPPPPPPPPSRAFASFTLRARPPKSLPSSACMARVASAFDISTNPNPRGRPVSRSVMSASDSTVPCAANSARIASSVAEKGRLPTNNLVTYKYSLTEQNDWQYEAASPVRDSFEVAGFGGSNRR